MNRYGICWYETERYRPFFVWRDQDRSHPAYLLGCVVTSESELAWIQFQDPIRGSRVTEIRAEMIYARDRASVGLPKLSSCLIGNSIAGYAPSLTWRLLVLHARWLEREIRRHGQDAQLPILTEAA